MHRTLLMFAAGVITALVFTPQESTGLEVALEQCRADVVAAENDRIRIHFHTDPGES
ncbi:MAG: hypothetical protein AAGM38_04960 [Pseudomonadota bacterium]